MILPNRGNAARGVVLAFCWCIFSCVPPEPLAPPKCKDVSCDVRLDQVTMCPEVSCGPCQTDVSDAADVADVKDWHEIPDVTVELNDSTACPECPSCVDVVCPECPACDAFDFSCPECPACPDVKEWECEGEAECPDVGVCEGKVEAICVKGEWVCDYSKVEGFEWGGEKSCDGLDNDCDGETDEGLKKEGYCVGVCEGLEAVCEGGEWKCEVPEGLEGYEEGEEESCDGLDNDCDGETDEGLCEECEPGERRCNGGKAEECRKDGNGWEEIGCEEWEECKGEGNCYKKGEIEIDEWEGTKIATVDVSCVGDYCMVVWSKVWEVDLDVFGEVIDLKGEKEWEGGVNQAKWSDQRDVRVGEGGGRWLVGWDSDHVNNESGVYGRIVGVDGPESSEIWLSAGIEGEARIGDIEGTGEGRWVIAVVKKEGTLGELWMSLVDEYGMVEGYGSYGDAVWTAGCASLSVSGSTLYGAWIAPEGGESFAVRLASFSYAGSSLLKAKDVTVTTSPVGLRDVDVRTDGTHVLVVWVQQALVQKVCYAEYDSGLNQTSGPECFDGVSFVGDAVGMLEGGNSFVGYGASDGVHIGAVSDITGSSTVFAETPCAEEARIAADEVEPNVYAIVWFTGTANQIWLKFWGM